MASLRKPSGKDKANELRKRVDDSLDTLARAVDNVRASEVFRQYLTVQARFHHYSWHNTMMIATQRPGATQVAGFRTWQTLKRQVRKGERGIMIFAPRPARGSGRTTTVRPKRAYSSEPSTCSTWRRLTARTCPTSTCRRSTPRPMICSRSFGAWPISAESRSISPSFQVVCLVFLKAERSTLTTRTRPANKLRRSRTNSPTKRCTRPK